jgi:hypothetical protein
MTSDNFDSSGHYSLLYSSDICLRSLLLYVLLPVLVYRMRVQTYEPKHTVYRKQTRWTLRTKSVNSQCTLYRRPTHTDNLQR